MFQNAADTVGLAGLKWIAVGIGSSQDEDALEMIAGDRVLKFGNWCDLMEEIIKMLKGCCDCSQVFPRR